MVHEFATDDLAFPATGSVVLPLLGSLLLTGAVAALVCQPPQRALPWPALVALAAGYLLLAALAHAAAVSLVRRLFEDALAWPAKTLLVGLWSTVAWLPLLSLLTSEDSLWVAATLPLLTNCAVSFLKRHHTESEVGPLANSLSTESGMELPFWRALLPSALASAALEGGVCALVLRHAWLAGLLLAGALALPVWRLVQTSTGVSSGLGRVNKGKLLRDSTAAWLLTAIALLPFSTSGLLAKALLNTGVRARPGAQAGKTHTGEGKGPGGKLAFVVLLQPPHPREKRVDTPPELQGSGVAQASPAVIPFDGPYWFFKRAGDQPDVRAHVERGDPRKVNIRSSDELPMLMEAHQAFVPPLHLGSSRGLRLDVSNADDRPGVIAAEMVLQRRVDGKVVLTSLGTLPLRSSGAGSAVLGRAPMQDSLFFALPERARGGPVEAITVRFKPDRTRNLAAPLIAIRDFVLVP